MPDPKQLPHLLKLMDDSSPSVKQAVYKALAEFGTGLDDALSHLANAPPDEVRAAIREQIEEFERTGKLPGDDEDGDSDDDDEDDSTFEGVDIVREAQLAPGQLIKHRRHGYRGVIVDVDLECKAEESWYRSNVTQPPRQQPWYHVLVDGSDQITYAAQTSLLEDDSGEAVSHPLVPYFFTGFVDGVYLRNDRDWPT